MKCKIIVCQSLALLGPVCPQDAGAVSIISTIIEIFEWISQEQKSGLKMTKMKRFERF